MTRHPSVLKQSLLWGLLKKVRGYLLFLSNHIKKRWCRIQPYVQACDVLDFTKSKTEFTIVESSNQFIYFLMHSFS